VLDTTHEHGLTRGGVFDGGSAYGLKGRSLVLLQEQRTSLPGSAPSTAGVTAA